MARVSTLPKNRVNQLTLSVSRVNASSNAIYEEAALTVAILGVVVGIVSFVILFFINP